MKIHNAIDCTTFQTGQIPGLLSDPSSNIQEQKT